MMPPKRRWIVCVTRNFTLPGNHAGLCWGGDTAREVRRDFWLRQIDRMRAAEVARVIADGSALRAIRIGLDW